MTDVPEEGDPERIRYFHAKYVSYSRAVGVMFAVLTIGHLIITMVCLVQPSWLQTTDQASTAAYFGLWRYAIADPIKGVMIEKGSFLDFDAMPAEFKNIAILIALAVVVGCVSVLTLGLIFCLSSNVVFMACGWLMSGHGVVMGLACILFPKSWTGGTVQPVCRSDSFDSGKCEIGKAYLLAGITAVDSVILAVLAFILAYRQVTLLPWSNDEEEEGNANTGGVDNPGKTTEL